MDLGTPMKFQNVYTDEGLIEENESKQNENLQF